MANNFSGDSNCKALWNMESGALTTDSVGSNTLTDNNTVGESTGDFKQGACAADLEYDNNEYLNITDANLDSGFPLKSGDTNKIFSLCAWFKPESVGYLCYLASKYDTAGDERTLAIQLNANQTLGLVIGYNSGASYEGVSTTATLTAGRWYHLGITFDDSDGSYRIELWDDTAQALAESKTGNFSNSIYVGTADFVIGNRSDASSDRNFDGLIDEMVVFDDVLSAAEIDSIRRQTYGGTQESVAGSLSIAGSLLRKLVAKRSPAAAITSTGQLSRTQRIKRITSGSLSASGALTYSLGLVQQAVAGVISMTGALVGRYKAHRSISGAVSSSGGLSQKSRFFRGIAGVLSMSGSPTRGIRYFRVIAGSIAIAGTAAWVSGKLIGGVIALAGALTARAIFRRSVGGEMGSSGSGDATHNYFYRLVVGILRPLGAVPMGNVLKRGLIRLGKALNLR